VGSQSPTTTGWCMMGTSISIKRPFLQVMLSVMEISDHIKEFTISSFTIYYLPDNKPSLAYAEDGLFIYYLIYLLFHHLLFNSFTISSFTIYYLILRLSYTPSSHHQIITSSNLHIITSSNLHIITLSHHHII